MNIADLRSIFHWLVEHWKTWGIPGVFASFAMLRRWIYAWVLEKYDDARDELAAMTRRLSGATAVIVPEEAVMGNMFVPRWLIVRARRWEKRKKRGLA